MRLAPLMLAMGLGLAACAPAPAPTAPSTPSVDQGIYGARTDTGPRGEPIEIHAVRKAYLTERNRRQQVAYNGPEAPGTIVVDPYARFLYYVMEGGQAMRYGVAVGQAGKNFQGTATINRKAAWPSWTPTANMVRTMPELYGPLKGGLAGGVDNPLGSRALYLYQNGRDTMYRIHGTMDPSSIGKATSAGCIRMFNQDIMDLFDQVPNGTRVKVRSQAESLALEGPLVQQPNGYLVPAASVTTAQATTP
ncbi:MULTISPECIES: L,D-transpeptidase [unclassified Paracoccus (in: a-proteobacteria)]|uniref:L,D-transpeptidase n=1 Tax=unclassified Paracoccus (in: a-proteobacteria) TaxID=2688777 RepID=UPI0012B1E32E|nr:MULTISPECIES: L,D-transpeptidase [unclassified Paracoccus (in: a-proteobacteria)]UXU76115.1 L,D-transpeptidase [Paracoccus sp. SMMA_5]UXU82027.1 L,D-transpeptidase [Paracoccus sp. SMMA_5_TC]